MLRASCWSARFVLEHHLEPVAPLAPPDGAWEQAAYTYLFQEECRATVADVVALVCDARAGAVAGLIVRMRVSRAAPHGVSKD